MTMVSEMGGREVDTPSAAETVELLRRFNRTHTQRVGALEESFLDCGRPLGQSRLLFEIGHDGASVVELRHRLGLDSGYLSRLLGGLEADGLVELAPDPADARRRIVRLTAAGRRAWRDLDRRSETHATGLIEPLSDRHRERLHGALATAERLLRAATLRFEVVDPQSDAALASMTSYFAELDARFTDGFDPGDTLTADAPSMRPPNGEFVVAFDDATAVACGGLLHLDESSSEIKRMWVDAAWRGVGLGARMLHDLERRAAERRSTRVVLDTNATLLEAIEMYERAGYAPIERYNDNPYAQRWFERHLDPPGRSEA